MKRIIDRPTLLVVVFGLAALVAVFGPWGVAPALAYDPMGSGVEILVVENEQITLETSDSNLLVSGDLNSYSGGVRCEIATLACTGKVSIAYEAEDRQGNIDLDFRTLDPASTEYLVITMGACIHCDVINYSVGGTWSEQTPDTFRATFTDNRDGTLRVTIEFPNGEQIQTVTITLHLDGTIGGY